MAGDLMNAATVLKIGQRVEFYLEDDDIRYTSRIEDITSDRLVVAMPVDEKRRPIIPAAGEQLYGLAVGEKCRYRFFSVFKGKARAPIPVWMITKPEVVERHQNRSFVRAAVRLPIQVRIIDTDGRESDLMKLYTTDVSGGGVSFIVPRHVRINSRASIVFTNFPNIGTLSVMARVVRSLPLEPSDRGWQLGAHFLELDRGTMNKIVHFVFCELRRQLTLHPDSPGQK
ncbi:flagellar brake protein [uncultured Selenomonas sp.]|uniref:flagellar brake protein n=1 Tax=uncultured Selenomonas sp. TaxID=159275 RepID=UPI0026125BC9|nr:flagellar brake domain-containing protein [uncultured Selenomonas sp.]